MPGETGIPATRRIIRREEEPARDRLSIIIDRESGTGLLMFAVLLVLGVMAAVALVWVGEDRESGRAVADVSHFTGEAGTAGISAEAAHTVRQVN